MFYQSHVYLWDDASLALFLLAHHGVGLPSAGLSVGEDAHVVPFEGVQQHLLPDVIVHTILRCKTGIFRLSGLERGREIFYSYCFSCLFYCLQNKQVFRIRTVTSNTLFTKFPYPESLCLIKHIRY